MIRKIAFALIIAMILAIPVSADYTLQFQALTNSPADGATVYVGIQPVAPTATPTGMQVVPAAGTINVVEIYDYSGTAGTNQEYAYYLRVNNATDYLVAKLSVAASERVFTNSSMNVAVVAGDTLILKRVQPTWTTNPLTNIVGGYALVDTPDEVDRGYTLYGMALSNSPADSVTNYIGGKPAVPSTTEGQDKVFIPTRGTFTKALVADYSGTAGTAEPYAYYLDINSTEYLIENRSVAQSLRMFNNTSGMNIPVQIGNYLQFKRNHPAWVTNPLTNVVGATAWVNITDIHDINDGYPIHSFALTHTPADGGTVYYGYRPIAPSTTAGTNKMYIRQVGTIKKVGIYSYSGTAGTGEPWAQYIVVNNTDAYLIANISVADNERMWINTTMNITVVPGDYVEMKSEQPVFATNPATTIYGGGFYLEYEDELPVASFTTNATAGTAPVAIQFTNTSATAPTGWDWFWTCVENSTTYHFSTLENPVETFDNGHFDVRLNVTNASGWSTSAATRISVSDTGGYSGFTQQDIYLSGFYTITWTVVDSTTNVPIAVVAISDAVTGQANSTTAGIGSLSGAPGLHYINFVSTGYTSKQVTYVYDGDASYTVQMVPASPSVNPYYVKYPPKDVRFHVQTLSGTSLSLAHVEATPIQTTLGNYAYVASLFGYDLQAVPLETLALNGSTDSRGDITFAMMTDVQYSIVTTKTGYTFPTLNITPHDDNYLITANYAGSLFVVNGTSPAASVTFTTSYIRINQTTAFVNLSYVDFAGATTSGQINITQTNRTATNLSNRVQVASTTFTGNSSWANYTFYDGAVAGCPASKAAIYNSTGSIVGCSNQTLVNDASYQTGCAGNTPTGTVYQTGTVWFKSFASPIAGLSPEFALFIALFIMMFTALMAGTSTAPAVSLVVTFEGWVFYGMNMFVLMDGPTVTDLTTGITGAATLVPSVLTIMTFITIVWLFVEYRRKGK